MTVRDMLNELPIEAYPALERFFKEVHSAVREKVLDIHKRKVSSRENLENRRRLTDDGDMVLKRSRMTGSPLPEVAMALAIERNELEWNAETYLFYAKKSLKKAEALALGKRNRNMVRLARKGKSNHEIATTYGLSVSRTAVIVAAGLKGNLP